MNKQVVFLLLSTCIVILSVAIIAVGPMTNSIHGQSWGYQNCALISDKIKLLKGDVTKYKKMKNLCYRQKAMHDMEYTSFIINIILGFLCADLALIVYLGYGKEFEIQTGVIGLVAGIIVFILTLVYVCYSGYIFTQDVPYLELSINNNLDYLVVTHIPQKLYSNGAIYKFEIDDPQISKTIGSYIAVDETEREDFATYIRYKDLGKKQYNYNSDYYKKYKNYNKNDPIESKCRYSPDAHVSLTNIEKYKSGGNTECDYLYAEPIADNEHKYLFDRWLSALVLACVVLICNLGLAFSGLLLCSNFGNSF